MQRLRDTTSRSVEGNWDVEKLKELGVSTDFISTLNHEQAKDLVKGLLYLGERSLSQS
jgi:hypothetical protein